MKVKFIILLVAIITTSCNKSVSILPFDIAKMQKQIEFNPDSIAYILEEQINPMTLSGKDKADYWFLLTQTHLKQDRSLINDSLIHFSVDYYKSNNSPHLSAAYRLSAYQTNWAGNKDMEEDSLLLKALEVAENKMDTFEIIKTYNVLTTSYFKVKEHTKAIDIHKKIIELTSSSKTKAESMYWIGIEYALLEKKDSCFLFLDKAAKLAKEINYTSLQFDILRNYADCLNYFNDSRKALEIIKQADKLNGNFNNKYYTNFTYLNAWLNLNQLDSAKVYISHLKKNNLNISPMEEEYFAFNFMTEALQYVYNEKKGLTTEILSIGLYGDDVRNIIRNNIMVNNERVFIQSQLSKEKDRLEIEKARQMQIYLIIIIVLLLITGAIIFIYQRKILQKERAIQIAKDRLQKNTIKLYENENIIKENELLIRDLTNQIEENSDSEERLADIQRIVDTNKSLQKQNDLLHDEIDKYSTELNQKGHNLLSKKNIALQERERFLLDQLIINHEILNKLKYSPQFIKEEQWPSITNTINVLYNNYAVRLQAEYPIFTGEDIRYCCLIELRLSTSNIGTLMAVSSTSVSKRKQRIKEKMTKVNSGLFSEQSLENYLWNY